MNHRKRWLILGVCLLLFLGLILRYVPFNYFNPDNALFPPPASAFRLELDSPLPSELKVGDQLTVTVRLINRSWMSYKCSTGEALFHIFLKKPGQEFGETRPYNYFMLWAGVNKTESATFDITSADDYTLIVYAYFSIGGQNYHYQLDDVVFHVIE